MQISTWSIGRRYATLMASVLLLSACAGSRETKKEPVLRFLTIAHIPVVEGKINGKRAYFIVDTGATCSILNTANDRHFGFTFTASADSRVHGLGGTAHMNRVFNCEVQLGPIKLSHRRFRTKDLSYLMNKIRQEEGILIAGLIGADVLKDHNIAIDFGRRMLRF